jgi:hypothetical protein
MVNTADFKIAYVNRWYEIGDACKQCDGTGLILITDYTTHTTAGYLVHTEKCWTCQGSGIVNLRQVFIREI